MKRNKFTWLLCFAAGIALQGGVYWYLDSVKFAPDSDFYVTGTDKAEKVTPPEEMFGEVTGSGTRYYSYNREYMAMVTPTSVTIYHSEDKNDVQKIDLKGREVSFFEWLPDRNLILMALYDPDARGTDDIIIAQYNPLSPEHELDTPIEDVPAGAKGTAMAYSTATNAVYMKVKVDEGRYRIYRTDANYDTRRIYVQAENIGRIDVYYDRDVFFYDDADEGVMYAFNGSDSSWRTISPPGFFRLIGVDQEKNIYAVRLNEKRQVAEMYIGKLGVGFESAAKVTTPLTVEQVTPALIRERAAAPAEPARKE